MRGDIRVVRYLHVCIYTCPCISSYLPSRQHFCMPPVSPLIYLHVCISVCPLYLFLSTFTSAFLYAPCISSYLPSCQHFCMPPVSLLIHLHVSIYVCPSISSYLPSRLHFCMPPVSVLIYTSAFLYAPCISSYLPSRLQFHMPLYLFLSTFTSAIPHAPVSLLIYLPPQLVLLSFTKKITILFQSYFNLYYIFFLRVAEEI